MEVHARVSIRIFADWKKSLMESKFLLGGWWNEHKHKCSSGQLWKATMQKKKTQQFPDGVALPQVLVWQLHKSVSHLETTRVSAPKNLACINPKQKEGFHHHHGDLLVRRRG
jgi:hypothetical protein